MVTQALPGFGKKNEKDFNRYIFLSIDTKLSGNSKAGQSSGIGEINVVKYYLNQINYG